MFYHVLIVRMEVYVFVKVPHMEGLVDWEARIKEIRSGKFSHISTQEKFKRINFRLKPLRYFTEMLIILSPKNSRSC